MGMDRTTVIGFVLIGMLLMGMFYFNNKGNAAFQAEQQRIADSLAKTKPKVDLAKMKLDSLRFDSTRREKAAGSLQQDTAVAETTLENEVIKITFTNKGAQPKIVELKNYKTLDGKPVIIQQGDFNKISYEINTGDNVTGNTSDLVFASAKTENGDKSQTLTFSIKDSAGKQISHQYTLHSNDYLLDFAIILNGADKLVSKNTINLQWQTQTNQIEKDEVYEKGQTHICYLTDGGYDFTMLGNSGDDKKFEKPVDWLSVKQQFFVSALVNKNKFQSAEIKWTVPSDTSLHILAQSIASFNISIPAGGQATVPLQLYYGPSDYHVLKAYNNKMENIVPYGSGVFAFVKYINRHVLLPVFDIL
jgi:YidC/Oxa1 family membrane protein insertase